MILQVVLPVPEAFPADKGSYRDLTRIDRVLTLREETEDQFRRVYRAQVTYKNTSMRVVIKEFDLDKTNPTGNADTLTDVQKEVAVMRGCCNNNIVQVVSPPRSF